MFKWLKSLLSRLWTGTKRAVNVVTRPIRAIARPIWMFCTKTKLRKVVSVSVVIVAVLASVGYALGLFAAATAVASMGIFAKVMIAMAGTGIAGTILASVFFGISAGGGGTLMLYSAATGQYYMTLVGALWVLGSAIFGAGLAAWAISAMLAAPAAVTGVLAFCAASPGIAFISAVAALVILFYTLELAYKGLGKVWNAITRRNEPLLLPA